MIASPLRCLRSVFAPPSWRFCLTAVTLIAILLTGCGGAAGKSIDIRKLKIGYAETLDTIDVADQEWIRRSNAKTVRLSGNQTVVQAVSQGLIDLGNAQFTDFALAVAQKNLSNIRVLYMGEQTIPFIFVGRSNIKSLGDLAGKVVAYHSPGSLTEIMARLLVRQYSPTLEKRIVWRVVPESANRAVALRAGRVDAAVLDYPDVTRLENQGVHLNRLGVWNDLRGASSQAVNTVWIVRKDVYDKNPATMLKLARMIRGSYDRFYSNKAAWIALARKVVAIKYPYSSLSATYDFYKRIKLYPVTGTDAFSRARLNAMNRFFRSVGTYTKPVAPSFVAFSLIRKVSMGSG